METKYNNIADVPSYWEFNKGYIDFVDQWLLMRTPITPIILTGAYLFFVLKLGPAYMKNKPPYSLRNVIFLYNVFQVAYSCYMFWFGVRIMLKEGLWERKCLPGDTGDKEYAHSVSVGAYMYVIAKLTELLDTVFFVLRKKGNQITFLHVYHHSYMFFASWFSFKYSPSYTFAFMLVLNTFVHIIMYTYYGLSAIPGLAKYLWWKKYITKLQLIQFSLGFIIINVNYIASECPQSSVLLILVWIHFVFFTYMFSKFYIQSYTKKGKIDIKSTN